MRCPMCGVETMPQSEFARNSTLDADLWATLAQLPQLEG